MKHYLILIFSFISFGYADPFYGESEPNKTSETTKVEQQEISKNPTACNMEKSENQPHFPFEKEKLKLVGILKNGDQFKALYLTDNQQLVDLKIEDLLGSLQIKSINLKSVEWIDWQKTENCQQPFTFMEKL
ncbi:hypothetical protein [Haemophilus paracuniculus]|nr:hypothetical protein [Haemophilus paracuniculus]